MKRKPSERGRENKNNQKINKKRSKIISMKREGERGDVKGPLFQMKGGSEVLFVCGFQ